MLYSENYEMDWINIRGSTPINRGSTPCQKIGEIWCFRGHAPPKTPNFALELPPLGGRAGVGGPTTVRCSATGPPNTQIFGLSLHHDSGPIHATFVMRRKEPVMHMREIQNDSLYRSNPSLVNRAQSLFAMLIFFLILFALLSGPAWLPLVVDRMMAK